MIFDEFHERSLNADLGLALCLESQETLREDLRILVMSATLDLQPLARLLDDAPIVEAEARSLRGRRRTTSRAAPSSRSSCRPCRCCAMRSRGTRATFLCFLPGAAEIGRVQRSLEESSLDSRRARAAAVR